MDCPTCRKKIEAENASCPRCETELVDLWDLSARAAILRSQAKSLLIAGRAMEAFKAFCKADRLCSTNQSRQGIAAALLASGRFKAALTYYLRKHAPPTASEANKQKPDAGSGIRDTG